MFDKYFLNESKGPFDINCSFLQAFEGENVFIMVIPITILAQTVSLAFTDVPTVYLGPSLAYSNYALSTLRSIPPSPDHTLPALSAGFLALF